MKTSITIEVERLVRDAGGIGYHADTPAIAFTSEADGKIMCISCGAGTDVWRLHISDFLCVAERFNAATKYRTDFPPFLSDDEQ